MGPSVEALLEAIHSADCAADETVEAAGRFLVWGLRKCTRHPRLSEVFPDGCLLVSQRGLPEDEDCIKVPDEVSSCRAPLPGAWDGGLPCAAAGMGYRYALREERLEPVELRTARHLLSELSRRQQVRLALPVLVAVADELDAPHASGLVYIGAATQAPAPANDENAAPQRNGLHISETIRVTRPVMSESTSVGELFSRCRGCAQFSEVRAHARYDLGAAPDAAAAWAPDLPVELLPGPFISLVVSWPTSLQQAACAPLDQTPAALTCSAVVRIRGSHSCDTSLLRRPMLDLDVLRRLTHLDARDALLQPGGRAEVLESPQAVSRAIADLIECEARLATCATAAATAAAEPQAAPGQAEDEERPSRDFLDRLWADVLSRCRDASLLVHAVQVLMKELGRPEGSTPFVRRDNGTEAAELVRSARKMSTARRYASPSEADELQAMLASWEEKRAHYCQADHVIPLVLAVGMECLRKDFVHLVTRRGCVVQQDLGFFVDQSESTATQLERLRCLHRIAELTTMGVRHRLCADTLRRLFVKAAEHYRGGGYADAPCAPNFSLPLSKASISRLLSTFPSVGPSHLRFDCGASSVCAQRVMAGGAPQGALAGAGAPGVWSPDAASGLFSYHVTVVDRFRYAG